MGRPPTHGAPSFRFHPSEVAHMEAILREHAGHVPPREFLVALAEKFSNSPERSGKITVQMKQVWNWFQNRRYALRSKLVKAPGNSNMPPNLQGEVAPVRNVPTVPQQTPVPSGHNVVRNTSEIPPMEFEAKSARDGAWYDVQAFLSHRYLETGNPEVLIRFAGFGQEEDEWVNVRKHVRQRSLPCESSECIVVLPGDLILCFQEGKEQALYFDAHVLDAQRRRHDVRGCRCRFLVRYDHDQSEEIVPLRKICRRPETDYRLQVLQTANESASASASASVSGDSKKPEVDPVSSTTLRMSNPNPSAAVAFTSPTMNPVVDVPAPPMASAPAPGASAPVTATASAPAPGASAPVTATASAPAPAGILSSSSTLISASAPSSYPISAPTTTPSSTLVSAPTPTPSSTLVSAPTPTPSSTLVSAPTPTPSSTLVSAPTPTPSSTVASALTPTPSSTLVSAPTPSLTLVSAPTPFSTLVSAPTPSLTLVSAPTPSSTLVSAPTPSSTPSSTITPVSAPTLAAIAATNTSMIQSSTPAPNPVTTSFSGPPPVSAPTSPTLLSPTPAPTSVPVPIQSSIPVVAPELKKIESDEQATLAGEASVQEKIINPGSASIVLEAKKEESSIHETSTVAGSRISQGEMSDNHTVTIISPEKLEDIAPSEPITEVSAAAKEGGPIMYTGTESTNLPVSTEDSKE